MTWHVEEVEGELTKSEAVLLVQDFGNVKVGDVDGQAPGLCLLVQDQVTREGGKGVDGTVEEVGVFHVVKVLVGEEEVVGEEVFAL